ncbi:hypothetical protein Klosneuvirus_1_261 [Klosneuvirus KNV1]|uniref:Uncharacterized protein n=1 Tax=Klosneuvirus KNV1 TaxID=1977640 RepID=A0A1V0SID6_9VIRU|nr:hypothetical protein Klosneuvirus_1_261 [Klosneuvirus KNV1]
MNSQMESQVVDSPIDNDNASDYQQCSCPMCRGQCQWCSKSGCGMCSHCKNTRCPLCPYCAKTDIQNEPFTMTEKIKLNLTFDRFLLFIILILVGYIAWKHYRE